MKVEELHLIQEGDEIKFTSVSHVHGIHDTVNTAIVIGITDSAALIKRGMTIAVQPHRIIAVRRGSESIYAEEPFEESLPAPKFEETGDYTEFNVTPTIHALLAKLPADYPPATFTQTADGYMLKIGYTLVFQGASSEDAIKHTKNYVEAREGHPNLPVGVIYGIYD